MTQLAFSSRGCFFNGGAGPTAIAAQPPVWSYSGVPEYPLSFVAGETVTVSADDAEYNGGTSGYPVIIAGRRAGAPTVEVALGSAPTVPQTTPWTSSFTIPTTDDWKIYIYAYGTFSGYCYTNLSLDGSVVTCAYGTEANPDATLTTAITSAVIDLVVALALAPTGDPVLIAMVETSLAALEGSTLFIDCTTLPAPSPPLDLTDVNGFHFDRALDWFKYAAWQHFCQCTPAPPGSPDPVGPAAPRVTAPAPPGTQLPVITCDNGDICATLNEIVLLLGRMNNSLQLTRRDLTIMQRQGVPFAYVEGTLHVGLTGTGTLDVSDILGLSVQCTTVPNYIGRDEAAAQTFYGLGELTIGTADGWRSNHRITKNPYQLLPIDGDVTKVGYSLASGVVANIRELVAEPL